MRASSSASSGGTESCWSIKCAMPAARAPGRSVSPSASSVSASPVFSRRNGTPWACASRAVSSTWAPPTVHAHCAVPEAMALMGLKVEPKTLIMEQDRIRAMDEQGIDVEALSINPYWYKAERDLARALVKIQNE